MLFNKCLESCKVYFSCILAGSFEAFLNAWIFWRYYEANLLESCHLPLVNVCEGKSTSHWLFEILIRLLWSNFIQKWIIDLSVCTIIEQSLEITRLQGLSFVKAQQPQKPVNPQICDLWIRNSQKAANCNLYIMSGDFAIKIDIKWLEGILRCQIEISLLMPFPAVPFLDPCYYIVLPFKWVVDWLSGVALFVVWLFCMVYKVNFGYVNFEEILEFFTVYHAYLVWIHQIEDFL